MGAVDATIPTSEGNEIEGVEAELVEIDPKPIDRRQVECRAIRSRRPQNGTLNDFEGS